MQEEVTKRCRMCGEIKPLSEFDKADSCTDGHRCVCKACRLQQTRERKAAMRQTPEYVENERMRAREKYRKYKEEGRIKPSKTPNGMNVAKQLKRRGYNMEGKEAHHWNYNLPKSVFLVSKEAHEVIHRHMRVNYDNKCGYTEDGVLIETPEQAKAYFESVLLKEGINEKIEYVDYSNTPTLKEPGQVRDLESFINRARAKFGNRFKYDKSVYRGYDTPMLIGCDVHGYFWQSPSDHLHSKHGCSECSNEIRAKKERYTTEEFIHKAKLKHGDLYSYEHAEYNGSRNRITVTCPIHGDFDVFASFHLAGRGCDKCSKIAATRKMIETVRNKHK